MRGTPISGAGGRAPSGEQILVPIQRELMADMLTPVSAFGRLCPPGSPGFLLESVEGGERLARYSFIGYTPQPIPMGPGDPLNMLGGIAAQRPSNAAGLPRFIGGAVGYLRYEVPRPLDPRPPPARP